MTWFKIKDREYVSYEAHGVKLPKHYEADIYEDRHGDVHWSVRFRGPKHHVYIDISGTIKKTRNKHQSARRRMAVLEMFSAFRRLQKSAKVCG